MRGAATAILSLLILIGLWDTTSPALGQTRAPLLIEGKTTLFQRVLTRPGAKLSKRPGDTQGTELPALSVLYVYGQKKEGNGTFIEVGSSANGTVTGFLNETDTIPWRHTLTLAFTNPANRGQTLFFEDRPALVRLLNEPGAADKADRIRIAIKRGMALVGTGVIAAEPDTFVDLQKQFYLLPVLEAHTVLLESGFRVRSVQVASVTKDKPRQSQRVNPQSDAADFRSGIVFVIDASSSMQPYIDRTREAMEEVFRRVEAAKLNERVRFGMIAYRDDPRAVRGIEYLAKVFADPNRIANRDDFLRSVGGVGASPVSTRTFAEDGYAGIEKALTGIDWNGFGGRFLIMITDASSREGNSPFASTGLATDQTRQMAQDRRAAIYVLHLLTAEGKSDHADAKAQYERLSNWPGVGSLYFPVEAGDPAAFGATVKTLAGLLIEHVRKAEAPAAQFSAAPADRMQRTTEQVGLAMRLAYVGEKQGTQAPTLYSSWASDRDIRRPDLATFSVRVLLTKNQLSDLQATLGRLVVAGERAQVDPGDFFNQLRSAAVAMGRDPARLGQAQVRNLEQSGLMGEYLEGLPYQSKVMSIDQDMWVRMSVGEQQALLDEVKSKIALYQRYHDDVDRWVLLAPNAEPGDAVYPVPIDTLP